jgi:hypothetical protein
LARRGFSQLVLLGFLLTLPVPARADIVVAERWEHVTLETWDGWLYYDVTVAAAEAAGYLLITRGDGSQRLMAYEEVRSLESAEGTDLTGAVVPTDALLFEPQAPPEFARARPQHDKSPQLERWQPRFRVALSGGVGWGTSLGDWFSGLEGGVSFSGQVRMALLPELYFTALVRDQDLDVVGTMPNYPGGYQVFDGTGTVRQFGVGAGVMLPRGWYRDIVPYFECLLAGASHDLVYDERGDIGDYVEELNDDQLAGILQFGALVPVSRVFALDAQAHWMFTGASDWAGGSVLGLSVGICVMLADAPAPH